MEPTTLQRQAAIVKDVLRLVPKPIVMVVRINGHPARALLDSGSLGDFISTTLAEQRRLNKVEFSKPIPLELAAQGSRSKVIYGVKVSFQYQGIDCLKYFDLMNLARYDVVLGTPFLFQHKVLAGLNQSKVVIGKNEQLPIMEGANVAVLSSHAMDMLEDQVEIARESLREYAQTICRKAVDTELPPLRKINHKIILIDPDKTYEWRPSKCPEALRPLWIAKRPCLLSCGPMGNGRGA